MFEMWRIAGVDSKEHLKEFETLVLNKGDIPLVYTTNENVINYFNEVIEDFDVEVIAIVILNDGKLND